jgi:hypothetical protein
MAIINSSENAVIVGLSGVPLAREVDDRRLAFTSLRWYDFIVSGDTAPSIWNSRLASTFACPPP